MRILYLIFLIPFSLIAQKNGVTVFDSVMQAEVKLKNFNGNVLVARSGHILFQNSYGYGNYTTRQVLDSNSLFEMASVTKQFTAMGILQLIEAGKLKLTDSLRKFFPALPYSNITIQQLLTHVSGLPEFDNEMHHTWDHKKFADNRDVIDFLVKEKPAMHFSPGQKWEYSNTAFVLLASIIEQVSGLTYKVYIERNIFKPLHMHHSGIYNQRHFKNEAVMDYANGYMFSDSLKRYIVTDSLPGVDYVYWLEGVIGHSGIFSTTGDLLIWQQALRKNLLLSASLQKQMFSKQSIVDTAIQFYYGYGQMLGMNELGNYFMHTGGWPGYSTMLLNYPKEDLTIIVLSNNESKTENLSGELAYAALGKPLEVPYKHVAVNLNSNLFEKYMGRYRIPNVPVATTIRLFTKDGKIYCCFENGGADVEYLPESAVKLFDKTEQDQQFEFESDADGNLKRSFYIYGGMKKEIKKL